MEPKIRKGMKKLEVYSDDEIVSVIIYKIALIINGFAVIMIVGLVPNSAWKLLFSQVTASSVS